MRCPVERLVFATQLRTSKAKSAAAASRFDKREQCAPAP
jgi:hypothetical protein